MGVSEHNVLFGGSHIYEVQSYHLSEDLNTEEHRVYNYVGLRVSNIWFIKEIWSSEGGVLGGSKITE